MAQVVTNNITSGYNLSKFNNNFINLSTWANNVAVSSSGGNGTMYQDFDMNGFTILNAGIVNVEGLTIGGSAVTIANLGSLGPNSVATAQIIDGSVTDSKIQSVSGSKATFIQKGTGATLKDLQTKAREHISVQDYGAVGDGVHDDTAAIQAAVNYAQLAGGGSIYMPAGVYLISSAITISRGGITIYGDGWETYTGNFGTTIPQVRGNGTWINQTSTTANAFVLANGGANRVIVRDLAFMQNQPQPTTGWTPTTYNYCIQVNSGDCLLENLYYFGVDKGVQVGQLGSATGRTKIHKMYGEFFHMGVHIAFCADVMTITDMHNYPFWSGGESNVNTYKINNSVNILSERNDNPQMSNLFALGCNVGLFLGSSADGITSKGAFTNLDFDFCSIGVNVSGNSTSAQFTNLSTQQHGSALPAGTIGIAVPANACSLMFNNTRISYPNQHGVYVSGTGNFVSLVNSRLVQWDFQRTGSFNGVFSASGNTINISGMVDYQPGTGTAGAFLGGTFSCFTWPNFKTGLASATTTSIGNAAFTHNLGWPPNVVTMNCASSYPFLVNPQASNNTSTPIKIYDATAAGAGAANGSNFSFYYTISM